jgi:FMN phosphatase YigB (HAD superfamily)
LRQQALAAGHDHECHHDELVRAWLHRLLPELDTNGLASLTQWVEEAELALERLALQAKPNARLFLQWAKSEGLRVLAISDMYLGQRHLDRLLNDLGYGGLIDRVYVSSEHRVGKYSTRLFREVWQREGLAPEAVLHVGDNFYADALAPAQLGACGVFLKEQHERRRRRRQRLSWSLAAAGRVWPGRMLAEVVAQRLRVDARAKRDDPHFQYGLEVIGPIFSVFMLGVLEQLRAQPVDQVMFLARDGYLFQRMYERAQALGVAGATSPARYVYISRAAAARASVAAGLTLDQARVALFNPKQRGLRSILKTYGLAPEDFVDLAAAHGLDPIDEPLRDAEDPRLQAFLADERVQARVRPAGTEAAQLLHRYFDQQGFFAAARVAWVDIGWNATIQRYMEKTFAPLGPYPWVDGYYFAYVHAIHQGELLRGAIHGLLFDRRRANAQERAPLDFEELFEQAARAPHGTTLGYRLCGDRVEPLLKDDAAPDRQAEIQSNPLVQALQDGVLLCWEHVLAAQTLTGFDFAALKPYAQAVAERAVVYPSQQEVALISALAHTEDFGHDDVLDLAPPALRWWHWLRPQRLLGGLRSAAWPFALMARWPGVVPALLARYWHLTMVRAGKR